MSTQDNKPFDYIRINQSFKDKILGVVEYFTFDTKDDNIGSLINLYRCEKYVKQSNSFYTNDEYPDFIFKSVKVKKGYCDKFEAEIIPHLRKRITMKFGKSFLEFKEYFNYIFNNSDKLEKKEHTNGTDN